MMRTEAKSHTGSDDLLHNLDKLHTTEMGVGRIRRVAGADTPDAVDWCKQKIAAADQTIRKGKNWYARAGDVTITVNAHSYTVITVHREKGLPG